MKFSLKNAKAIKCGENKGFEYNTKADFPNASVVYAIITEKHGKLKNTKNDRVYMIIEGKGEFIINNNIVPVEKMDVVIIPKNTPYDYKGNMKILLVDTPAFEASADIRLE